MLDGLTMHKATQLISGTNVEDLPQGPLRAVAAALLHLGWSLEQAHIIRMADTSLDLTSQSPAMLKHYIRRAFVSLRDKEATHAIVCRGNWPHEDPPAWGTIRRFLRSRK